MQNSQTTSPAANNPDSPTTKTSQPYDPWEEAYQGEERQIMLGCQQMHADTVNEILSHYPHLTREQVEAMSVDEMHDLSKAIPVPAK